MAQKIKTILISQPKPSTEKSPYFDLAERQKITIDFRPFIHVEGMEAQDFRQQRVDLAEHTAVIFTSRSAAPRSGAVKGLAAAGLSCGVSRSDGSAAIDASGADVLASEQRELLCT